MAAESAPRGSVQHAAFQVRRTARRFGLHGCQREEEGCSLAHDGFAPDGAAMALDNLLAGRKTKARSCKYAGSVQTLEGFEDPCVIRRVDTDSVVFYGEQPSFVAIRSRGNTNLWPSNLAILYGVGDEVLQKLRQLGSIADYRR